MRITYRGDYALKTILDLALHYGDGPLTIADLARHSDIPFKFLEQILLDLKRGGFVKSRRGKVGGYLLAQDPSRIKVGDIIRFIDGPIEPVACVDKEYRGCREINRCILRGIWQEVAKKTAAVVDSVTFEDLARKALRSGRALVYQI